MDGAPYDAAAVEAAAKEWIDGVNSGTGLSGGWRLQFVRLRTRRRFASSGSGSSSGSGPSSSSGSGSDLLLDANGDPTRGPSRPSPAVRCPELPMRIRRFAPGCPWALVDAAVRYLHRIAPYTGIVYNGVSLRREDGSLAEYRPTRTVWQRDEQDTSPGSGRRDATYTLIQDLVEVTDCEDEETLLSGASCSQGEETTYVFDADAPGTIPDECPGQGVTWSVRAVSRDDEGLWSYQLVKTVARSAAWGPYVVECTPRTTTTEWGWDSLYGDPASGDLWMQGCDGTRGESVSLPRCGATRGVRTQVQTRRNPDCTWNVEVRERVSVEDSDQWDDGTACAPSHTDRYYSWRTKPEPPAPAPGETVRVERTLDDDGTWNASITVSGPPAAWDFAWEEGSECRPRRVHAYRNQLDVPDIPKPGKGETVNAEVQRGDDCLYDGRVTVSEAPGEWVEDWWEGSACRPRHVEVWQDVESLDGILPDAPPADGSTVNLEVTRTEECLYRARKTTSEKPSDEGYASWTDGTCSSRTEHEAWTSKSAPVDPGQGGPGETVSASWQRNDDCTYSGRVSRTYADSPAPKTWTEGSQCRPVDVAVHWNVADPSAVIPSAGRGETVSASVRRNADCTFDVEARVRRPSTSDSVSWTDGSCAASSRTTLYTDVAGIVDPGPGAKGSSTSASWRKNDDCTYTGQVSVTERPYETKTWTEGGSCDPVTVVAEWGAGDVSDAAPPPGQTWSRSVQRNADCTFDTLTRVRAAQERTTRRTWLSGNQRIDFVSYSGLAEPYIMSGGDGVVAENSFTMNDDCTYSGTARTSTPVSSGGGSQNYLWGPNFSDMELTFVGSTVDPDKSKDDVAITLQASMVVTASRNMDDIAEDIQRIARQGWMHTGIHYIGSYGATSKVYTTTIFKQATVSVKRDDSQMVDLAKCIEAAKKAAADTPSKYELDFEEF